jgi:hypothetical protein
VRIGVRQKVYREQLARFQNEKLPP